MEKKRTTGIPVPPRVGWADGLAEDSHGGGCCGRFHLFDFDCIDEYDERLRFVDKVAGLRNVISNRFRQREDRKDDCGFCIEVVLANFQYKDWHRALITVGFKKVFTFVNQNSGRECRVYLLDTSKVKHA